MTRWYTATVFMVGLLLVGCGESAEEAYERGYEIGYEDGAIDVCNQIARFSADIEEALRSQRIC